MSFEPPLELYDGEDERVGFILKDGTIVECQNISNSPSDSFEVTAESIIEHADQAVATWHTHPKSDNNLSMNDYHMFVSWPELRHYILGTNGCREYYVENGDVLIA